MKKNFLQLIKISISLLLIFSLSNPVTGISGTDVWSVDSFIIFEADAKFIFNHAYYSPVDFPNVDITDGEIAIRHTGLNNMGEMLFSSSSPNAFLSQIFFGSDTVISVIDPETGLNEQQQPTYRFGETENWKDGEETDFKEIFEYTDDFGVHSNTIKYEIVGEKFEYSMKVDNVEKKVSSWKLEIDNELTYNDGGVSVQEKNLLQFTISDGNGVLIQSLVRSELNAKPIDGTTYETLVFFEFSMDAVKSEGVKLNSSSGSDSGFVSLLIPWSTLMTLSIMISFYRRRKT